MARATSLCRALAGLAILLATGPAAAEPVDDLLMLIAERLEVGRAVAEAKWNSGTPIADPAREDQVVDAVRQQAAHEGVDQEAMAVLIRAQIEASKLLQQQLHGQWRNEARPPFADPPDLVAEIRPKLDAIGEALPTALAAALPTLPGRCAELRHKAAQALAAFDSAVREQAISPLEAWAGCS